MTALTCDNESGPGGAGNTIRGLTHSSDLSREGLAMKATRLNAAVRDPRRVARFLAKVEQRSVGECWPWTKSTRTSGHGQFSIGTGDLVQAHRFAYTLAHGPIPDGLVVRHTCDNRPCCNPAHLIVGTQRQNIGDMHERGRASGGSVPRPGDLNPNAKITQAQADEIRHRRSAGESVTSLATEYGLSKAQVSRIANGKRRAGGAA